MKKINLSTEPAAIISAITSFVVAAFAVIVAVGLNISDDLRNAIIGVIAPTVVLINMLGFVIRQFVYSRNTTRNLVEAAFTADPRVDDMPKV